MTNLDKLVAAFLNQGCTSEQADLLAQYFIEHPEEMEYYFGEKEWNAFQHEGRMPELVSVTVWQNLQKQLPDLQPQKKRRSVSPLTAFAFIITISLLAWMLIAQFNSKQNVIVQVESSRRSVVSINNDAADSLERMLPDGSVVILYKGGQVRYDSMFDQKQRRVILIKGKAEFQVVANVDRPFLVQTDRVVTTAVGTRFSVDYNENAKEVLVQLLSGKVILRSEDKRLVMKEIFLQPGQQCFISQVTMQGTVSVFNNAISEQDAHHEPGKKFNGGIAQKNVNPSWKFYKKPLDEVLDALARHYHIKVHYNKKLMHEMHFTGELSPEDPLEISISAVCAASGLSYQQQEKLVMVELSKTANTPENTPQ